MREGLLSQEQGRILRGWLVSCARCCRASAPGMARQSLDWTVRSVVVLLVTWPGQGQGWHGFWKGGREVELLRGVVPGGKNYPEPSWARLEEQV